jgi:hypothetical protein
MIDIPPTSLIDHGMIAAAQSRLDDAKAKLENAKGAVKAADGEVARKWDESVSQIASGGDAMAGAQAHAAAVARRDFAVRLVDEFERNHAVEQENFRLERIRAYESVLKKGRELRLAAAAARDIAEKALAEANAVAGQGAALVAAAHNAGLRHFALNQMPRGAASIEAEEAFWDGEDTGAREFWGRSISK